MRVVCVRLGFAFSIDFLNRELAFLRTAKSKFYYVDKVVAVVGAWMLWTSPVFGFAARVFGVENLYGRLWKGNGLFHGVPNAHGLHKISTWCYPHLCG